MNRRNIIGYAKQINGMIKEYVGRMVGYTRLASEGHEERAEGRACSRLGRKQTKQRP
jgi:uncharacterized protein YjbJ (UPF0337 family)